MQSARWSYTAAVGKGMAGCQRDGGAKRRRRGRSLRASSIIGRGNGSGFVAPQLEGTGEILLESADRASGYFTTRSDTPATARTAGVYWRAYPEDLGIVDGDDDERRAALLTERLERWKSLTNA